MLKKCLKYDMKSIFSIWWILAVSVLALSLPCGMAARSMIKTLVGSSFPWEIFVLLLGFFAMSVFVAVSMIMVYVRYYNSFFKDEGYLTFTLPVKRSTLFLSKVLNAALFEIGNLLVCLVAVAIVLLCMPIGGDPTGSMYETNMLVLACRGIGELFGTLFSYMGGWALLLCLLGVLIVTLVLLSNILLIHFAITTAAMVFKKHPVLGTVGLLYGFNFALGLGQALISLMSSLFGFSLADLFDTLSQGRVITIVLLIALVIAAAIAIVCALLWLLNLHCIERKLNLA